MSRKSVLLNVDQITQQMKQFNFTPQEVQDLLTQARKFDTKETGYVQKDKVDDILRELKVLQNDDEKIKAKFNEELKNMQVKALDYKQVAEIYYNLKQYKKAIEEEESITQEYIDAFVALGGQPDKQGNISKKYIAQIVKDEFQLILDLEQFLGDFQGDMIGFEDFCSLFEAAGEDAKSVITSLSQGKRKKGDNEDFTVSFKEFQKWEKSVL
ncbi:hypothetical protein pb186bvf_005651 [Paramecium bursaria]